MKSNDKKHIEPGGVEEYIASCPQDVRENLNVVRAAIQQVAPGAVETVSYFQIPGYSYEGYDYNGMFVWFSYKKPYVRLHVRPPVIDNHLKEPAEYPKTASIVSFHVDNEIPVGLVQKLTSASLAVMKGTP